MYSTTNAQSFCIRLIITHRISYQCFPSSYSRGSAVRKLNNLITACLRSRFKRLTSGEYFSTIDSATYFEKKYQRSVQRSNQLEVEPHKKKFVSRIGKWFDFIKGSSRLRLPLEINISPMSEQREGAINEEKLPNMHLIFFDHGDIDFVWNKKCRRLNIDAREF